MSGKKASYSVKKSKFNWRVIPLIIAIAVIPLIVYIKISENNLTSFDFYNDDPYSADFFLYFKMIWFTVISAIMLVLVLLKLSVEGKKLKFSKIFLPLFGYGLLSIVSAICSEYGYFATHGIYEQFESLWCLVGYVVCAYYAYLVINTEDDLKNLIPFISIGISIMLLIGFFQFLNPYLPFEADFYRTTFGKMLMLPGTYNRDSITFNFEIGRVYMSLYNPNYVGSYSSLLFPVYLLLTAYEKRPAIKIYYGLTAAMLLFVLFGSQSRGGIIGIVASVVILLITLNKRIFRNWIPVVVTAVLLVGAFFAGDKAVNGAITARFKGAFKPVKRVLRLSAIETRDDCVDFIYDNNELLVTFDPSFEDDTAFFDAHDGDGNAVEFQVDEDGVYYRCVDERFPNFTFVPTTLPDGRYGFQMSIDGMPWNFARFDDTYYYVSSYGKFVKMDNAPSAVFTDYINFASNRGYIWSRTIPLLKKYFFLGSGPDTFIIAFPNLDYVGLNQAGYVATLITKPHNLYLQVGTQTGVPSLLCVIAFFLIYLIDSFKTYVKSKDKSLTYYLGLGIFAGCFGYMTVGLINDSTIAVAPVFWALIGIGLAVNRMCRANVPVLKDNSAKEKKQAKA